MSNQNLNLGDIRKEYLDCIVTKAGHNTFSIKRHDGGESILFHSTIIIDRLPNGDTVLNSGGWLTRTTKDRFNSLGYRIYQKNHIWYLIYKGREYVFKDGMVIKKDGSLEGGLTSSEEKAIKVLDRKVNSYADRFIKALIERKIKQPGSGDCWYCYLRDEKGETMGESFGDTEHLKSHIKEGYFVPSLLVRAVERYPISRAAGHVLGYCLGYHDDRAEHWEGLAAIQLKSSLKKYLRHALRLQS